LKEVGREQLLELEVAITAILQRAMSFGETLIVTNGNATWVQESAERFLPGLLPLLAQLRVVSARALYEHRYPEDPSMWKRTAFQDLVVSGKRFFEDEGLNLVALGDQHLEIDAARRVGRVLAGSSVVKTVKFREKPSVAELLGQLYTAEQALGEIVMGTESLSCGLKRCASAAQLASLASSWRCTSEVAEQPQRPDGRHQRRLGRKVSPRQR